MDLLLFSNHCLFYYHCLIYHERRSIKYIMIIMYIFIYFLIVSALKEHFYFTFLSRSLFHSIFIFVLVMNYRVEFYMKK